MDGVSTDRPLIDARLRRRSAEQLGLLDPQTRRKQRQHLVSEFDMFAEFVDNARTDETVASVGDRSNHPHPQCNGGAFVSAACAGSQRDSGGLRPD